MIIKMKFENEDDLYKLPDISYDNFVKYMFQSGSSDFEYDKYLQENNMVEVTDYNTEATKDMTLIIENPYSDRILKFKCIYDSDNYIDFKN